ncbi:MAG: hypothetical protein ACPGRD_09130 [Planktomarina sp.]
MGLRLETFGLPGSGKSTLTRACLSRLRDQGNMVDTAKSLDRRDAKLRGPVPVLWPKPGMRQSYRIAEFRAAWPELDAFFMRCYRDRVRNSALIAATGADVMKFEASRDQIDVFWVDEGFLHYGMHAITLQDGNVDDAIQLANIMPQPDAVILVDTTPEVAMENVLRRTQDGGRNAAQAARFVADHFGDLAMFEKRHRLIQATLAELRKHGVPVISQMAMGDIDEMAEATCKSILALKT